VLKSPTKGDIAAVVASAGLPVHEVAVAEIDSRVGIVLPFLVEKQQVALAQV